MNSRIRELIFRYDTAIWVRVIGTVMTTITSFMLRPFLVLYLYDKLDGSVILPMVILGLQPLMGILISLWGGSVADRFGRRPMMLAALLTQGVSMAGYMFAESVWEFAVLTILNGLGSALYFPAANAQVADVVPEERRAEVFALLHTALNVGAAAGPLLGLAVFTQSPQMAFGLAALASFIYAGIVWWKVPETLPSAMRTAKVKAAGPKLTLREHTAIFLMTFLAVPVSLLYGQMESTFPLHLRNNFDNYQTIFVWLMTINGTTVVLLQMWLAKRTEHLRTHRVVLVSYLMFALVGIGYGLAPGFLLLAVTEVIFTLGEMLFGPHMQKAVSIMAPPDMRGRYFSIYGMNWQISRALGPVLGGAILVQYGGEAVFFTITVLTLIAGVAQVRLIRQVQAGQQVVRAAASASE